MKLIAIIFAIASVASGIRVYYERTPQYSNHQSQLGHNELGNHGQSNLQQPNYVIQQTYKAQQSVGDQNVGQIALHKVQQQDYVSQKQYETQPTNNQIETHVAEITTDYHNAEQYNDYNNHYAGKPAYIGQFDTGEHVSQQENIGYGTGHSGLVKTKTPKILEYQFEGNEHGYQYKYHTENGIQAHEVGEIGKGKQVEGAYTYIGDDGKSYTVNYVADEHGFRAQGAHLPTPPPIPAAIAEALEKNAADEANGITDDGQYHKTQISQESPQGYHDEHGSAQYTTADHNGYYH